MRRGLAFGFIMVATVALVASFTSSRAEGPATVYAAASLTDVFPKVSPSSRFQFAGSNQLALQITRGAPADVFASADTANMAKAVSVGAVEGDPAEFASNTLEIAIPPDNPARVSSLHDLAKPSTKVVVCAPEVPCGAATEKVERSAEVDIEPVSEEQAVTDVLTKVESGEADAGLVYVTDVRAAGVRVERDSANRRFVPASEIERLRGPVGDESLSARNCFRGIVRSVEVDGLIARVEIDVTEPSRVVAIVTRESAEELGLRAGMSAAGIVKSTSVMVER